MRDDNDAFGFDLGFAIWQALRKRIGLDYCRRLAAVVIKHVRLCGVVVVQDTADGRAWLKDNSVGANCPSCPPHAACDRLVCWQGNFAIADSRRRGLKQVHP